MCPVCLDLLVLCETTQCGHSFCGDCAVRIIDGPCPVCRSDTVQPMCRVYAIDGLIEQQARDTDTMDALTSRIKQMGLRAPARRANTPHHADTLVDSLFDNHELCNAALAGFLAHRLINTVQEAGDLQDQLYTYLCPVARMHAECAEAIVQSFGGVHALFEFSKNYGCFYLLSDVLGNLAICNSGVTIILESMEFSSTDELFLTHTLLLYDTVPIIFVEKCLLRLLRAMLLSYDVENFSIAVDILKICSGVDGYLAKVGPYADGLRGKAVELQDTDILALL